jgi:hypothetical protein
METNLITVAGKYTPSKPSAFGWTVPVKPKPLNRKEMICKKERTFWAREGLKAEEIHSGDLLSAMHEDTDRLLSRQRFPNQDDFKKKDVRAGKWMAHTEFIRRILRLNKNLIYEDSVSVKDSGAFYLIQNGKKIYTSACFRKGWLREWTTFETDAADLPTADGLHYGWRTPLQRLIQKRIITYSAAVRAFGEVYRQDLCGKGWRNFTSDFRT